jgi:tRNA uridine 5-carboxymethylaminomethyl modification enzyme
MEDLSRIENAKDFLKKYYIKEKSNPPRNFIGKTAYELLSRPDVSYETLLPYIKDNPIELSRINLRLLMEDIKYRGYRDRALSTIEEMKRLENMVLSDIEYDEVEGLSKEGREKLKSGRPENIHQASQIDGIRAGEILSLIIHLKKKHSK